MLRAPLSQDVGPPCPADLLMYQMLDITQLRLPPPGACLVLESVVVDRDGNKILLLHWDYPGDVKLYFQVKLENAYRPVAPT